MPTNIPKSLSQSITWDFRISEQTFIARYGHLGDQFYKQVLPGGIEAPDVHPSKRIDPKLYGLARARYLNSSKSS